AYRVVRSQRPLYPWRYYYRMYPIASNETEIIHGETKTDELGKFSIKYMAIPDSTQDDFESSVFNYTIYVDITDLNGETRSAKIVHSVSNTALVINSQNIKSKINIHNLSKLSISTETINGHFIPATLNIEFKKLANENRLMRKRYWGQPDQFVMSKTEYIKNFPFDIYKDEDQIETWEQLESVFKTTVNTDSTGIVAIDTKKIEPGAYAILLSTKDKDGKEIKDTRYVFIQKDYTNILPEFFELEKSSPKQPGETAILHINSQAEKPYIFSKDSRDSLYHISTITNEKLSLSYAIDEKDRGGFSTSFFMVKNNRFFQDHAIIAVPWTNKDLSIEYGTYRNKLLPGATDTWRVTIKGNKKDKIAAEMLASMYDASLDQFVPHQWRKPYIWQNDYQYTSWNAYQNFTAQNAQVNNYIQFDYKNFDKRYDQFLDLSYYQINERNRPIAAENGRVYKKESVGFMAKLDDAILLNDKANPSEAAAPPEKIKEEKQEQNNEIHVRKNLQETAFFFPDLKTDKEGNISFTFTMPEALTKWKLQTFAHTKDLAFGINQAEIITQKELMVQPNIPRFLREGDQLSIPAKVVNLSTNEIIGIAQLQLIDAETGEAIDGWFKNTIPQQYFTIKAGSSENIAFPIEVPFQFSKAITWRIIAKTTKGAHVLSDGEESTLPVLTNSMLVTESLPISLRGTDTKQFNFDKLLQSGHSETLQQHKLTVEYTTNPAWYAIQALPYMMEYPYDCSEQTWNRYYANSLAAKITQSSPKVKKIFDSWKNVDTAALISNLEKNQELKSVLLEETPWVLHAKNENEQKKNIALLFDLNRMSKEQTKAIDKLIDLQLPNGGFSWFKGGKDDPFITQYIITGIGHLKQLNAIIENQKSLELLSRKAITYLDQRIKESYDLLLKNKIKIEDYTPSYYELQYLYMRSFYKNIPIFKGSEIAVKFYTDRAKATWTSKNKYMQSMLALALHRNGDKITPGKILQSLKEYAIIDPEMGMYFKDNNPSWWWYEAPIERQAMMIEAFNEISKDNKTVDDLKTWLLKNKQTTHWNSTKATAEACYALLLEGSDWISEAPTVTIQLGKKQLKSSDTKTEAGTGYFKESIDAAQITASMGNIKVSVKSTNKSNIPSWGAVYWQYFEQLDKISFAATPLQIKKNLFITKNSDRGPVLELIKENDVIKVGDKITVRIEIKSDRDMEYVHMKDMRASSFEPTNVLSTYKWQDGLGYYETTKDASTNFFFSYLRKGTYVFEYTLFAATAGNFSNGVTTIQCMYAPEFTAHSEGVRVNVEK
ncbi:MAG: alpha-2-macroglobulin, partial [Chitinophagaceae bacterium]